jgi:hypothetical protein
MQQRLQPGQQQQHLCSRRVQERSWLPSTATCAMTLMTTTTPEVRGAVWVLCA